MLKSFFDFGKAESFYSEFEERFKKEFQKEFGVNAIQTLYEEGGVEDNIRIWADFSNMSEGQETPLYHFVKSNKFGNPLDEAEGENDVDVLARKLIDLFLFCMEIKTGSEKKVHIYVYDFLAEAKNYIYGNSLATIRLQMKQLYDLSYVFVFREPIINIICKDVKQKLFFQKKREQIVNACYDSMKKFDNYNILQKQDVAVVILCEAEVNPKSLNDYFM